MSVLRISVGDQTEDLLQFVLAGLDDSTLDSMEVQREHPASEGLASEPITIAVVLALSSPVGIKAVARLIEKWMEVKRQSEQVHLLLQAFSITDEAGRELSALAQKHADISLSFGPPPA